MTRSSTRRRSPYNVVAVVGVATLLVAAGAAYIATTAQKGLPLQDVYRVNVDFPNAVRLEKTNAVSIGGVRVGSVQQITPVVPRDGRAAYVRVELALEGSTDPLPVDTRTRILSSSVLGQTYVDLEPGGSGEVVQHGGTLSLANARSTVQLNDLFAIFDRSTARDIRSTVRETSAALAGRGGALNAALASARELLPPLQRVASAVSRPSAGFERFLTTYATFVDAFAPVSDEIASGFESGGRVFGAVDRQRTALGQTVDQLPATETAVTTALNRIQPSLDRLANLAEGLEPASARLPRTLRRTSAAAAAGVEPFRLVPGFSGRLEDLFVTLRAVTSRRPVQRSVVKVTDLLRAARPTVLALEKAQVHCNALGITFDNLSRSTRSYGTGVGPPAVSFAFTTFGAEGELLQQPAPASNLNVNYTPIADETQCVSGNEPADGVTQRIGNPSFNVGSRHPDTDPPPASTERAREAGLLTPPRGWRP